MGFWDAPYPGQSVDPGLPPGYAPPQDPLLVAMMGQGAVEPPPDQGGYRQYGGSMVTDPDAIAKMDQQPQPWAHGQQWALSRPHTGDPYAGMTPAVPDLPDPGMGSADVPTMEPGSSVDDLMKDPKAEQMRRLQELEALGRQLQTQKREMQKLEGYDPEAYSYTRPDQRWLGI